MSTTSSAQRSRRVRLPRSFSTSGAAGSVAADDGASATVVVVVELAPVPAGSPLEFRVE